MADPKIGINPREEQWHISRVVQHGRALYVTIPTGAAAQAGIKRHDRLGVTVEGRTLLMERIPFEELATRLRGARPRVASCETQITDKG